MRLVRFAAAAIAAGVLLTGGAATAASVQRGPVARTPQFDGPVHAIAYLGDTVYVGGAFAGVASGGKTVTRTRLAAFNARTGDLLDWSPKADGTVRSLATDGNSVYAVGDFSKVSEVKRDSLAKLDATSGAVDAFSHEIAGSVLAVGARDGRVYVAGHFSYVDGARRTNAAAFDAATGVLDPKWAPAADDTVEALVATPDRIYLGGGFHKIGGASALRLAAVDPAGGALDKTFEPRPPAVVLAVAADADGTVYVGMGGNGGRAASYTKARKERWTRVFDGDVQAVTSMDGIAYVGGHFDKACTTTKNGSQGSCTDGSTSRVKLAAVDAKGKLLDWAPQANGIVGVRALAASDSLRQVSAGGEFTTVGGANCKRVAVFQ